MENTFFYEIKVGRITRAGNMDALHSFVCKTDNSNQTSVYNYFNDKYSGLNVVCNKITNIVTEVIPVVKDEYSFGYEEPSPESKKIKELKQELNEIKKESDVIKDSIYSNKFPKEALDLIEEMKGLSELRISKRDEAESIVKTWLYNTYSPFVEKISFPDNIKDSEGWFKYSVYLKGKLIGMSKYYYGTKGIMNDTCTEFCKIKNNGIMIGSSKCQDCENCLKSSSPKYMGEKWILCSEINKALGI